MIIKSTKFHAHKTVIPLLSGTVDSSVRVKRLYGYLFRTMWERRISRLMVVNPEALEMIYYGGLIAGIVDDLSS